MEPEDIEREVLALMREAFETETLPEGATMENTEVWDSLHHIMLMNLIEKRFNLRMEFTDIVEMTSLERIVEILMGYPEAAVAGD